MYKIETHLHTKPVSNCAYYEPEEMIRFYKKAGYNTVFVSDHLAKYHFDKLGEDLSWEQKVDLLYDSYLRAQAEGEKLEITVLFSPELTLQENHYLLYHVTPEFLKSHEDLFTMTLEEFYHCAKANQITIIQAHPYRDGKCTPQPAYVDGFEVINSHPRHENFDEKVFALLKEHPGLASAGSDAHRTEDVAGAAVLSPYEIKTTDEYLALLRSGRAKLMKHGEIINV